MLSTPIYKRDTTGNVRTWQYEVVADQWRTIAGILGGNLVTSGWTTCTAKSKATPELQAQFEAEAAWTNKLTREYHLTQDTIDTPNFFKPMLAETYDGNVGFPAFVQPKLDGIRCIATIEGLFTRQGKRIFGAPHVHEDLEAFFQLQPDAVLDGELYNHALKDDFNEITSIVRKAKPDATDLRRAKEQIQYHVYDLPVYGGAGTRIFSKRSAELQEMSLEFGRSILLVDTREVTDHDELDAAYAEFTEAGYEGQMVRLDAPYQQKRSKHLLKRKEFQSDEFPILRIEEGQGNWAGFGKRVVCALTDGREFGAGVKGNQAFARGLLVRKDTLVGKKATIKFFAYTPDGVPRFPVAIDFDRAD